MKEKCINSSNFSKQNKLFPAVPLTGLFARPDSGAANQNFFGGASNVVISVRLSKHDQFAIFGTRFIVTFFFLKPRLRHLRVLAPSDEIVLVFRTFTLRRRASTVETMLPWFPWKRLNSPTTLIGAMPYTKAYGLS